MTGVRNTIAGAVAGTVILLMAPALTAQFKDVQLASRALTDADLTKYVVVLTEVTKARKGIPSISSPAGMTALREATSKAADTQGWASGDYSVVGARMTVAEQHVKMEKNVPVPESKKADVDLFKRWQQKIAAARK